MENQIDMYVHVNVYSANVFDPQLCHIIIIMLEKNKKNHKCSLCDIAQENIYNKLKLFNDIRLEIKLRRESRV